MPVSLKDISKKVGINICSVSQVLNDHPRARSLRAETREKILAAARELGYCRNEMAASMTRKHGRVLAFVTAEMGSVEYTGRIQNGVLDAASALNYMVSVHRLKDNSRAEILKKILGWKAAGVIFHVSDLKEISEITAVLDKNSIPWGTVNLSNPGGIGVTSDDRSGVETVVALLCRRGHRHPAFLTVDNADLEFLIRREEGYIAGMKEYYPDREPVIIRSTLQNKANDAVLAKIKELAVDAVICENDYFASALIRDAAVSGLAVPEKLSVIGFGNSIISEALCPGLTTVAQDFEAMGQETVRRLIDRIDDKSIAGQQNVLMPVKIVERDSVYSRNL